MKGLDTASTNAARRQLITQPGGTAHRSLPHAGEDGAWCGTLYIQQHINHHLCEAVPEFNNTKFYPTGPGDRQFILQWTSVERHYCRERLPGLQELHHPVPGSDQTLALADKAWRTKRARDWMSLKVTQVLILFPKDWPHQIYFEWQAWLRYTFQNHFGDEKISIARWC